MVKHAAVIPTSSGRSSEILVDYSLYILQSKSCGRFYVGSSQDPAQRLRFHNTLERGFTSRYLPWEVLYVKEYPTKREAFEAERKVKRWKSRKMIENLVNGLIQV